LPSAVRPIESGMTLKMPGSVDELGLFISVNPDIIHLVMPAKAGVFT
jgi:hypothetical protein